MLRSINFILGIILLKFITFLFCFIKDGNGFVVGIISGIISSVLVTIIFDVLNNCLNNRKLKVILDYLFKLIKDKHMYHNEYKYLLVLANNDFEIIFNELNKVLPIATIYLKPERIYFYMNYYLINGKSVLLIIILYLNLILHLKSILKLIILNSI